MAALIYIFLHTSIFLSLAFFIIAVLTGVKWFIIMMICICPVISDVEPFLSFKGTGILHFIELHFSAPCR